MDSRQAGMTSSILHFDLCPWILFLPTEYQIRLVDTTNLCCFLSTLSKATALPEKTKHDKCALRSEEPWEKWIKRRPLLYGGGTEIKQGFKCMVYDDPYTIRPPSIKKNNQQL